MAHYEDDDEEDRSNPFQLPDDDKVFMMRDQERRRKAEHREQVKKMRIWQKTTSSSRMMTTKRIKEIDADTAPAHDSVISKQAKHTRGLVAAATAAISNDRRREKENMADFIAKKREMFLVQMSLDTKREEIRKLEEKAQMKEEALKKSELMLEEDAIRFDTFLKENDKKAHEAIKRAEAETKAKQDKVQEIKKLNQQIQLVQSDMSKLKDSLTDCLKYKEFLDDLTPPEHFEEQKEIKRRRQEDRRQARFQLKLDAWEEAKAKAEDDYESRKKEEKAKELRAGGKKKSGHAPKVELTVPPVPRLEDEGLESSGGELPMYFQTPQQLLDIFTQLEESNLFLIQNSQETEQALEELKQNFRDTKQRMEAKTGTLKQNIEELRGQINAEEAKAHALRKRVNTGTGEDSQEDLLMQLHEKVKKVYAECGTDADANPSTLTMLTELEAKLEYLLGEIERMVQNGDGDYVTKAEKKKEKERRELVRAERMQQQQVAYDERLKKSMERSLQAPKKQTGKKLMFRSAPIRKKSGKKKKHEEKEVDEDLVFFQEGSLTHTRA